MPSSGAAVGEGVGARVGAGLVSVGPTDGNGLKFGGRVPAGGVGAGVPLWTGVGGAAVTTIVPFIRSGWIVQ